MICGTWWNYWQDDFGHLASPHHVYDIRFCFRKVIFQYKVTWLDKFEAAAHNERGCRKGCSPLTLLKILEIVLWSFHAMQSSFCNGCFPSTASRENHLCTAEIDWRGDIFQKKQTDWRVGYCLRYVPATSTYPTFYSLASSVSWKRNDISQGTVRGWRWLKDIAAWVFSRPLRYKGEL